jgi:two-component system chemotaxis sensor kinase CheA
MTNHLGLDDDFMATMLSDFLDESYGYLTRLNENLLVLDGLAKSLGDEATLAPDPELLNEMFRDAHSLKGLSAMLQLTDINSLTHKVENVFDAARQGQLAINRTVIDVMFQAFDRLTGMVERLKEPDAEEVTCQAEVESIQRLLTGAGLGSIPAAPSSVAQVLVEGTSADAAPDSFGDVTDECDIPPKYLSIFIAETEESLDSLADLLFGENADVNAVLVLCHRIKGSAASIGLNRTAKLAHAMEDLLEVLRDAKQNISDDLADTLLSAVDSLRAFVQELQTGVRQGDNFAEIYPKLRAARLAIVTGTNAPAQSPATPTAALPGTTASAAASLTGEQRGSEQLTSSERSKIATAAPAGRRAIAGVVLLETGLPLAELKAQMIFDRLAGLGALFFRSPSEAALDSMPEVTRLVFGIATELPNKVLRSEIDLEGVERIELCDVTADVSSGRPDQPLPPAPAESSPAEDLAEEGASRSNNKSEANTNKDKPAETIRVDIERLDQLMNLAGQLVINKARFAQLGDQLKGLSSRKHSIHCLSNVSSTLDYLLSEADHASSAGAGAVLLKTLRSHVERIQHDLEIVRADIELLNQARAMANGVSEAVHQLDRIADGIQKSVMDTRMVPIGPLFGRFKRVIRDITRMNGKEIQLVIRGEKTELDKRMVDELGDPLIHMIRNSADHGIETPADRLKAGKPPQGTITLEAFHRGNRVIIQVKDDGRGLDPEKIRAKAIAKGLISAQDAERLTPQQTYQLIWEPGFSTADKVTEISGRGMGMDIVRSKIEQLNGAIELASEPGKGTTITIKLPLTMAILPSLLTKISGDVFAIPVESVIEIVRVRESCLATVHGLRTARIRGRVISVVDLNELLQWRDDSFRAASSTGSELTLVIVGMDGKELGIAVDELIGEEDIVIKSLAENYRNVHGLAGASILGNGRVSLILDVAALVALACRKTSAESELMAMN